MFGRYCQWRSVYIKCCPMMNIDSLLSRLSKFHLQRACDFCKSFDTLFGIAATASSAVADELTKRAGSGELLERMRWNGGIAVDWWNWQL